MKPQVKEYNCATKKEIVRDATDAEILQMQLDATNYVKEKAETEAKATAKLAAEAKLAKLGLTAADLQALGL